MKILVGVGPRGERHLLEQPTGKGQQTRCGNTPVLAIMKACLRVVVRGRSWKVGADRCAAVVPRPANGRAEPRVRALRERRHNVGEDETVGNLCQPSSDTMGCATWE